MKEPATYRSNSRPSGARPDESARPPLVGAAVLLLVLAALWLRPAGPGAIAVDMTFVLVLLVGHALLERRRLARARVESFLGADFVIGPTAWRSRDGQRRIRRFQGERALRWETVDPFNGQTSSVRLEACAEGPSAAPPIERRIARVSSRRATAARWVLSELMADGVQLAHLDADGRALRESWHPDTEAARRQLEAELGRGVGAFRPERRPSRTCWETGSRLRGF